MFAGDVTGFSLGDVQSPVPLFHAELIGKGTVTAIFDDPHPPFYPIPELTYTFAATTEPGTFALVALCGFGIIAGLLMTQLLLESNFQSTIPVATDGLQLLNLLVDFRR